MPCPRASPTRDPTGTPAPQCRLRCSCGEHSDSFAPRRLMLVSEFNPLMPFVSRKAAPALTAAASAVAARMVEALETRTLFTAIAGIQVFDANTDRVLMTLLNGGTIDYGKLQTRSIDLVAVSDFTTASTKMTLDGESK